MDKTESQKLNMAVSLSSGRNQQKFISSAFFWMGFALSLYFMFITGSENTSWILISLFTVWVSAPFLGILSIQKRASDAPEKVIRRILQLKLWLPLLSALSYSGLLLPAGTKPAFIFLVMPFLSWAILGGIWMASRKPIRRVQSSEQ